ncbi:biotin transporter BioY [Salinibaculum salinum]|uniref:biotin transporter BioY n=1 Tax=Salinibaculum salinum TaxID=3131996 RepID=UPI0030ED4B58
MSQEHESVELVPDTTVSHVAVAVLLAALTAVLAQISIPLGSVPFSFQPFPVFFAGLLLGPLWGGFAVLLYIVVGLAGAPVFSGGGAGVGYFLGPTGGFLVGFLLAAVLIGALVHRSVEPKPFGEISPVVAGVALLLSLAPIYAVGVPWLAEVSGISLSAAASAMSLYAVGDVLKVVLSAGIVVGGNETLAQLK